MRYSRSVALALAACLTLLAACAPVAGPPAVVEPVQPTAMPLPPTQAAPVPLPVVTAPPAAQYLPFCQAAAAACQPPTVEMLDNSYCVEKVPYAIMAVPVGTTYEPQDSEMRCVEQLHADGRLRVTCTGKELWSYDLKLCSGACGAPALTLESPQCPAGYGLDAAQQCCAQPAPAGETPGCILYKVDIGACPSG